MSTLSNRWFAWPGELDRAGILGINRRNVGYISQYNRRALYPRVDNKLLTKEICEAHSIPVPQTYHVLHSQGEVRHLSEKMGDLADFVVKPAGGAAGRGIMVIARKEDEVFYSPGGRAVTNSELRYHISTIISGLYSLGGQPDNAIIEQRIVSHPALTSVAVGGTPDVRVILFQGVPTMAMVRLPTESSGGRANLHQGAIAAAVDLMTGVTYGGVCKNRAITHHPDTGAAIAGIELPGWRDVIVAAMRLGDALEMGYVGVDFVMDATMGPVVLEANARPGLAIQVAHGQGLRKRLDFIDAAEKALLIGEERWKLIEQVAAIR